MKKERLYRGSQFKNCFQCGGEVQGSSSLRLMLTLCGFHSQEGFLLLRPFLLLCSPGTEATRNGLDFSPITATEIISHRPAQLPISRVVLDSLQLTALPGRMIGPLDNLVHILWLRLIWSKYEWQKQCVWERIFQMITDNQDWGKGRPWKACVALTV